MLKCLLSAQYISIFSSIDSSTTIRCVTSPSRKVISGHVELFVDDVGKWFVMVVPKIPTNHFIITQAKL